MAYTVIADELREAMAQDDVQAMEQLVADMQPADFAEFIQEHPAETSLKLLSCLPIKQRAETFGYFNENDQRELAEHMDESALANLFIHMNSDERADLFNLLQDELKADLMRRLARNEREDLRRLSSYEEGTAGSIMTSDYVAVPAQSTIAQAFEIVRSTAPDAETIYDIYSIDHMGRLMGATSLRELILARSTQRLEAIMTTELISATVDTPQEEVARLISRYDLLALPIIDNDARLVGIVTYDDAMDVAEQEATEDIHKGASVGRLDDGFGRARLRDLYRTRIVWLVLLVFGNLFSGMGIAFFEDTIAAHVALVFFLPLLIGSGGNAGAQASTLMVRGIATGDVGVSDWARLLGRELLVALALGLTMALAVSPIGFWRGGEDIAFVVAGAMISVVVLGSLIGICLPFILNHIGWDPATASAPLVTTLIDACGVIIYFSIAAAVLDLPALF